jgi:hypothetical protein
MEKDSLNEEIDFVDFLGEIAVKKRISSISLDGSEDLPISKLSQFSKSNDTFFMSSSLTKQSSMVSTLPSKKPSSNSSTPSKMIESLQAASSPSKSLTTTSPTKKDKSPHRKVLRAATHRDQLAERSEYEDLIHSHPDRYNSYEINTEKVPRSISEPAIFTQESADAVNFRTLNNIKLPRSQWMSDNVTKVCLNPDCRLKFSFSWRKHHCRLCGRIFCANCSRISKKQKFRVCCLCDPTIIFQKKK